MSTQKGHLTDYQFENEFIKTHLFDIRIKHSLLVATIVHSGGF